MSVEVIAVAKSDIFNRLSELQIINFPIKLQKVENDKYFIEIISFGNKFICEIPVNTDEAKLKKIIINIIRKAFMKELSKKYNKVMKDELTK